MTKNRDSLKILADILQSTKSGGSNKTKIMFSANLSYKLLEKYLSVAIRSGLIQVIGTKYELTNKGKDFMSSYKILQKRYLSAQRIMQTIDTERKKLLLTYESV